MSLLTQAQLVEVYDVPQADLSVALGKWEVLPKGSVDGKTRKVNVYDAHEAGEALIQYYANRMNGYRNRAKMWEDRIHDLTVIREGIDKK